MANILPVETWLKSKDSDDLVEIPDSSVLGQLNALDNSGTGVGFVFYLTPIGNTNPEIPDVTDVSLDVTASPVMRIKGTWYIVADENLGEIFKAILRMVVPGQDGQ